VQGESVFVLIGQVLELHQESSLAGEKSVSVIVEYLFNQLACGVYPACLAASSKQRANARASLEIGGKLADLGAIVTAPMPPVSAGFKPLGFSLNVGKFMNSEDWAQFGIDVGVPQVVDRAYKGMAGAFNAVSREISSVLSKEAVSGFRVETNKKVTP
jgi:hypothetical protein